MLKQRNAACAAVHHSIGVENILGAYKTKGVIFASRGGGGGVCVFQ